mmetsp:Transcript_5877/g.18214  ORF Transcript_5877/g.18214 Transcript_5877/m.18214 type:complete len:253 (-) Transcript_5877:384-1142(-)
MRVGRIGSLKVLKVILVRKCLPTLRLLALLCLCCLKLFTLCLLGQPLLLRGSLGHELGDRGRDEARGLVEGLAPVQVEALRPSGRLRQLRYLRLLRRRLRRGLRRLQDGVRAAVHCAPAGGGIKVLGVHAGLASFWSGGGLLRHSCSLGLGRQLSLALLGLRHHARNVCGDPQGWLLPHPRRGLGEVPRAACSLAPGTMHLGGLRLVRRVGLAASGATGFRGSKVILVCVCGRLWTCLLGGGCTGLRRHLIQ